VANIGTVVAFLFTGAILLSWRPYRAGLRDEPY